MNAVEARWRESPLRLSNESDGKRVVPVCLGFPCSIKQEKNRSRKAALSSSRTFPFVTSPLKRYTRPAAYTRRSIGIAEVTDLLCRLAGNVFPLLCLALPCLVPKKSASILSPLTRVDFQLRWLIITNRGCPYRWTCNIITSTHTPNVDKM